MRPSIFTNSTKLTAQIPASDLMTLGPATITVFNPASSGGGGGGASNALSFNVTASVSSISAASFSGAELAADSIIAAFGGELATQTLPRAGLALADHARRDDRAGPQTARGRNCRRRSSSSRRRRSTT